VKLLFDANLSPKLVKKLAEAFSGSRHVADLGLQGATDDAIWNWAKAHGFLIVSRPR
jgi:predicted nuclease of predicted toxin-antitoxin system